MENIIGQRLRALRERAGLSQDIVARIIGVSRPAYVNYENGKSKPTRKLKELAKFFNVTVDYILGESADDILSRVPVVSNSEAECVTKPINLDTISTARKVLYGGVCRTLSEDEQNILATAIKTAMAIIDEKKNKGNKMS